MLSVQGNIERKWTEKEEKCFWRGRDSSKERLHLITIARKHPELINASLTNFFFFRNEEHKYGPKAKHESFFKFFDVRIIVICLQYYNINCEIISLHLASHTGMVFLFLCTGSLF